MTLTFIQDEKISASILSQIYAPIWMNFSMLPQHVGLLKLMLNLFYMKVISKGENSADVILWDTSL